MGREKEEQIIREERARERAKAEGKVCGICGEPLLTSAERSRGLCAQCQRTMDKDD
jgi:hypothetical protein